MGKQVGPPISDSVKQFCEAQHVFFVGSAPLSKHNRVNVSPKSGKEFKVVGEDEVAYLDLTGSGSETAAHLLENGRLTIMFVAFEGPPRICRLFGQGRLVLASELLEQDEHAKLRDAFNIHTKEEWLAHPGNRAIVLLKVTRVADSCGYSIPFYEYLRERTTLDEFSAKTPSMDNYRTLKNSFSIDGLKSFKQYESGRTPSKIWDKAGYKMAEYETGTSAMFSSLWIRARMQYASGLNGWLRDVTFFVCGAAVALGVATQFPRPRFFTPSVTAPSA